MHQDTTKIDPVRRFTEIDGPAAVADLTAIMHRSVPRVRQVDFSPTEVVLCLAAMYVVGHNRYGGGTAETAPTPVPELAALFVRPATSILAKMANLAGTRPNGAVGERAAAKVLLADGGAELLRTYRVVLTAARSLGISEMVLPDFLPVRPWVSGGLLPSIPA